MKAAQPPVSLLECAAFMLQNICLAGTSLVLACTGNSEGWGNVHLNTGNRTACHTECASSMMAKRRAVIVDFPTEDGPRIHSAIGPPWCFTLYQTVPRPRDAVYSASGPARMWHQRSWQPSLAAARSKTRLHNLLTRAPYHASCLSWHVSGRGLTEGTAVIFKQLKHVLERKHLQKLWNNTGG